MDYGDDWFDCLGMPPIRLRHRCNFRMHLCGGIFRSSAAVNERSLSSDSDNLSSKLFNKSIGARRRLPAVAHRAGQRAVVEQGDECALCFDEQMRQTARFAH